MKLSRAIGLVISLASNKRSAQYSLNSKLNHSRFWSSLTSPHCSKNAEEIRLISKAAKKRQQQCNSPAAFDLQRTLGRCSKFGDLAGALQVYDKARNDGILLDVHAYNVLLYLCSSNSDAIERGFNIFTEMNANKVDPNEATFTSAARLAAAMEDSEMAFDLVKKMKDVGIKPKLRSYGPALFGFCNKGMADKAYEVYDHLVESGVSPEENEFRALLKVSSDLGLAKKVYEFMHKLRVCVRQVSEETAQVIENGFRSKSAEENGEENWEIEKVKEGVLRGGGGWHGQGWLGTGKWKLERTEMDKNGVCQCCKEKLVLIDIDPTERENFATSLSNIASKRQTGADFMRFQEWLKRHGPFDAVIDAANVGLFNAGPNGKNFNYYEVDRLVNTVRELSPTRKLPLLILHKNRTIGGLAKRPHNAKIIENWKKSSILCSAAVGSNDDWYWLYAAVKFGCVLVTNDEMRDHLFQLLGINFFPRWKEKHQVRYSISSRGINLYMPPLYSIVIQESEQGNWHIPTVTSDYMENSRQWICATRRK